jgi:Reverse transcriptase (RNA-dependent DNA polymerase)
VTTDWQLKPRDLKRYPHFDKYLPPEEAVAIATDPQRVAINPFFPFLRYVKKWTPYRPSEKPAKERPIRYASRRDAYIFARYRHLIAQHYEAELRRLAVQDCPIAYRKIPVSGNTGPGKCNINFARDAFDRILATGNCCVVALDISSYFENLDHALLRDLWCRMIGVSELPPDHAAVFRAITQYAVVDRDAVYERLGFIGTKTRNGRAVRGFLKGFKEIPNQLCSPKEFRLKIAGGDPALPSLIEKNDKPYGIPQGAPISDILANLYLIDFDALMEGYVRPLNGCYFRYSDDILIIVPGDAAAGRNARDYAMTQITDFGPQIKVKPEKTSIVAYMPDGEGHAAFEFIEGTQGKNGLEYLGFRFDGHRVYLRDSTLSGFYRKITYSLRYEVNAFVARYPGKSIDFLIDNFDVEAFIKKFGRVEDFDANSEYQDWTFWTYARRAAQEFGPRGQPILQQLRSHRELILERMREGFQVALSHPSCNASSMTLGRRAITCR